MSISGRLSTAKVAGTNIKGVQKATAADKVQELDGTTAEDQGYENPDAGLRSMEVSLMLVVDIATGDLTSIQAGTEITNLEIFANINASNPIRTVPLFLVLEATWTGEINGRSTYDVRGKAKGEFTLLDPN